MTYINNLITDALDEMISRRAGHMTIEPDRYNELLVNEQPVESSLPPMDSEEILADMTALGIDIFTYGRGTYLHFHEETQQSYKILVLLRELSKTFFLTFTYRKEVAL